MQLKKAPFILSFALSTLLVVATTGFASGTENGGASNMANSNEQGMTNMMENGGMSNMINAMNSPEGQRMMSTCASSMDATNDETAE